MSGVGDELIQASLLGEALDPGPAIVLVADEEMRYVAVNRHACQVLGYTRDELLALTVPEVARAEESTDEYADMVANGRRDGHSTLTRKDGSTVTMRYRALRTKIGPMVLYVAVGFVDED